MERHDIDALVADLEPVRRVSPLEAVLVTVALTAVAALFIAQMTGGWEPGLRAGQPHPMMLIRGGTLLLLGFAGLAGVIAAARPGVGLGSHGWAWAVGAAALFPASALALAIANGGMPPEILSAPSARWCLIFSTANALVIGAALTLWLRRGAPVAPHRAGWLVGLAAGGFGAFAYSLHCSDLTVMYIGFWYAIAVALCAVAGRIVVPPLIRW